MRSFRTTAGVAAFAVVLASFAGCRTGARTVPPPSPARPAAAPAAAGSPYFKSRYSGARTYLRPGPPSAR